MKWKIKKDPQQGDERWLKRFAWFPVSAYSHRNKLEGYWVWLQPYDQLQRYAVSYDPILGVYVIGWIIIDNYII